VPEIRLQALGIRLQEIEAELKADATLALERGRKTYPAALENRLWALDVRLQENREPRRSCLKPNA